MENLEIPIPDLYGDGNTVTVSIPPSIIENIVKEKSIDVINQIMTQSKIPTVKQINR